MTNHVNFKPPLGLNGPTEYREENTLIYVFILNVCDVRLR